MSAAIFVWRFKGQTGTALFRTELDFLLLAFVFLFQSHHPEKQTESCFFRKHGEGWGMDFMSFSTVFQSYQDNGLMIMKSCEQWNPVYDRKDLCLRWGWNPRLLDQKASPEPTELPRLQGRGREWGSMKV